MSNWKERIIITPLARLADRLTWLAEHPVFGVMAIAYSVNRFSSSNDRTINQKCDRFSITVS